MHLTSLAVGTVWGLSCSLSSAAALPDTQAGSVSPAEGSWLPHLPLPNLPLPHIPTFLPSHKSLCLLPLGDSITAGWLGTQTINGYRLPLLNLLTGTAPIYDTIQANATCAAYQNVTAVGFFQVGNFTQHYHEGWVGFKINQIQDKFEANAPKYRQAPDVVLLHAGSDDLIFEYEVDTAPQRLSDFIDVIFRQFPRTTIAVAAVTPFANSTLEPLRKTYNSAVLDMAAKRIEKGDRMFSVDMGSHLTDKDLFDGVHPSTGGYVKMARVWYNGIRKARFFGLLP